MGRHRVDGRGCRWAVGVVAGMVTLTLAACGSSPDSFEAVEDVAVTGGVGDQGDIGIEPVEPEGYRCAGTLLTVAEIGDLGALSPPEEARFAAAEAVGRLGERERWGVLASGWLVDTEPLTVDGEPAGLVVVGPDGYPAPCVPVSNSQPDQVWGSAAPTGQPDLDRARCEAVGDVSGLSVYWWDVPAGVGYDVVGDGQSLITGAVTGEAEGQRALDGPYLERLGRYGQPTGPEETGVDGDGVGEPEAEPPAQGVFADFGALALPPGTVRTYELHLTVTAAGGEAVTGGEVGAGSGATRTVPCGEASMPAQLPVPACSLSLFEGHPQIDLAPVAGMQFTPDVITVFRDGEPLDLGNQWGAPIDTTAEPGVAHRYTVEIRDRLSGRAPVTTGCGSLAAVAPPDEVAELRSAAALFNRVALGPHVYGRAERDGVEVPLVLTYLSGSGIDARYGFVAGFPADEALNPFTIHDQLIAALEAGRSVSYELGPTGLPHTWTVDGVTASFLCLNFDTQAAALRPDTACLPEYDVLGVDH